MTIQRYDLERVKYEDGYSMIGVELGDYVLYTDHLAALAEKEELIGQLQDGLHNLKIMKDAEIESKNEQLCAVIKSSRKVIAELRQVIKAQERLLVSYRVGGRPPEWVFDVLDKWKLTAQKEGV
jgi:hypothetical protein